MNMHRLFTLLSLLFFIDMGFSQSTIQRQELKLVFDTAAKAWEETFPLGNGRIGMMPDGGVENEHIVLNDITMWSGSQDAEAMNPQAIRYLPEIRQLLLIGKNIEAQKLMYEYFHCGGLGSAFGNGKDAPYGSFQMLGNLIIHYHTISDEIVNNYQRTLSLNNAVAAVQFDQKNIHFTREYFSSHSDDILVIRLTADKGKSISFDLELNRPERASVSVKNNMLIMEGQLNDGYNTNKGIRFLTKVRIVNNGGHLSATNKSLILDKADEAMILISSSSNMLDNNFEGIVDELLSKATKKSFNVLKKSHVVAFQKKFDRVELNLGEQNNQLTTNRRLEQFQKNDDPSFAALYFQFGRYLMISGTNENSLPLNLQGLWANTVQTPWNGDYHLNINVQMNYWPTEVCNLPELHKPLIDFTQSLVPSGTATAKTFYNAKGWVAHVITNPWHFTAPAEHASWGATNTGGAWLCEHLWEHYAFSCDKTYLRSVYPTLKGASDFFLSNMIEEPKHGWLVTAPSSSPENAFYLPGNNEPVYVCMGPTMDVEIIRELFQNTLQAAKILGIDDETTREIVAAIPKLPPLQISPNGYLQEWLEDYREVDPKHRHVSHLYALYPSNQISLETTPELAKAAHETLERRGDGGTGWSRAWKINFWARLHDGNRAYKLLKSLLEPAFGNEIRMSGSGGGTYPNLFCAHPPFQIDGNFGGTAGIAEMLIQSQNRYIELLPALPDRWNRGSFKGLRVRGGAEIDAAWDNKKISYAIIKATVSNTFKLKIPEYSLCVKANNRPLKAENGFVVFKLKQGEKMLLSFENG